VPTNLRLARPEHEATYQELCALVQRHAAQLTPQEILAVAANIVGKLIALQDQRTTTPEMAMTIVAENIEYGNQTVLRELAESKGSRA
jgi:hypothetical protein